MFPSDVLLPLNYKAFAFIDNKQSMNSHWDITWSFTFALTGSQHAICTFLTSSPYILSAIPGNHYNIFGAISQDYLLAENLTILTTESGNPLATDYTYAPRFFSIAFDSTGFFSLSNTSTTKSGTTLIPNSLVIRDFDNVVLYNKALSSLSTEFFLASSIPNYQTIRIRYANAGHKLSIDFRKNSTLEYRNLVSLSLSTVNIENDTILYPGFSFCSPISSRVITPSTLHLQNFHVQGNVNPPSYE
jgi:hypothetical protein